MTWQDLICVTVLFELRMSFFLETIVFDRDQWQDMNNEVDKFFFDYYL